MATVKQLRREEPLLVPSISDPVFKKESGLKEMIWFIAGALQQAAPQALEVQQICDSIENHQPWRIEECRGAEKRRNIQWILSRSPAFEHDDYGLWRMTGMPLVRTVDMLPVMTPAEIHACLDWTDRLFAPFRNPGSSQPIASSSVPLSAESTQLDNDSEWDESFL
ncbi:hypothetical protein M407DRAFT_26457 [Tulasnella calospora MUT 4182]|uniref:Uncharacterized protein n=1 Tax=Tulasnella calospora MUT 4182 TaxID=1051891 RepID=A0A0C3KRM6_9AGAM|nr:hypothetical protein M407DRAFT_26457 [Tulasnella calospora MUT 4182]